MKKVLAEILILAVGIPIGLLFFTAIGSGGNYIPWLESVIFPIVQVEVPLSGIYRDADKACFNLDEVKLSPAQVLSYNFWGKSKFSEPIPLSDAHLALTNNMPAPSQGLENHRQGAKWTRRYCFTTRGNFPAGEAITITGTATHDRHPIYNTITKLPTFTIPALK